jgi:hypothetical protein
MLMARSRASDPANVGGRRPGGCPTSRLPASVAEDHSAHLIAQAFDFFRVGGAPEAFGEVEEFPLLAPLSFHPVLDEFQQHPVGTKPACLRQAANLGGEVRRQADALPYCLDRGSH